MRWSRAVCVSIACCALCASCRDRASPTNVQPMDSATQEFSRCAFDEPGTLLAAHGQSAIEGALRRAIRSDRYAFSVRAGRCTSAIGEPLRGADPRARELASAWEELLPLVQSQSPDDITIERAIRRVGLAWRAARSSSR